MDATEPVTTPGDRALVAAMVAGDLRGLEGAYRRYAPALRAFAAALLRDADAADDVVHDTFVIAAEHAGQLRDPDRLRPWLFTIARRECLAGLRRRTATVPLGVEPPSTRDEIDAAVRSVDAKALVRAVLDGLGEADRAVLALSVAGDASAAELAAVLRVSTDHAHARLSRAREQFRSSLGALLTARTAAACPALSALLPGWDGRLDPLLRKRINRHLRGCAACTGRRDRQLRAVSVLAALAALGAATATIPSAGPDLQLTAAQPTPDATQPTPGPAQPTPGATQPTPGPARPTSDATQPTPGPAQPTPGPAQPTPGAAQSAAAREHRPSARRRGRTMVLTATLVLACLGAALARSEAPGDAVAAPRDATAAPVAAGPAVTPASSSITPNGVAATEVSATGTTPAATPSGLGDPGMNDRAGAPPSATGPAPRTTTPAATRASTPPPARTVPLPRLNVDGRAACPDGRTYALSVTATIDSGQFRGATLHWQAGAGATRSMSVGPTRATSTVTGLTASQVTWSVTATLADGRSLSSGNRTAPNPCARR
ncbi:sigma-70 family RNA polymerase sigma factor [Dactylosporangium siamense]|uniref:RNA polymerase sigma-70 region 2 domain-containing protein n=1 Tax=Dactylosporangium siamense TaxID=685454 RepID=A0A919PNH9_9ACTN|nr:sigma-70 family RNA polymerase sigma factor [Dactylosporangium siamense]GIG47219.1 hypothetical protein Dsi01nite_052600 [Dactylosporangium siamense]